MPNPLELTRQKFTRLTVLGMASENTATGKTRCNCICDCGNFVAVISSNLVNGNTRSCGCLKIEITSKAKTTHGKSKTLGYYTWGTMIARCTNPKNYKYPMYGGRGITVCESWLESFANFSVDMGDKPAGKTLDRIDVNGNYEPSNCRWASPKEQANNTRRNRVLTLNGESLTLTQWSERLGVSPSTLHQRIAERGEEVALSMKRKIRFIQ